MKRVGIIGAGISGLTLAALFKQHKKYKISIFEKDKITSQNINGIQISPNALRILNELNFEIFDKNKFCNIEGLTFYDHISKKKIATMNFNYLVNDSYITLNRNDLIKFLIDEFALKDIIIEKEVIKINSKSILLKDKTERSFDILIIADGIFSNLRSKKVEALYSGLAAFRGIYSDYLQSNLINLNMGKDFHLVTYPIDQYKNYSFTLVKKMQYDKKILDYNFTINSFKKNFRNLFSNLDDDVFNKISIKMWPIYKLNKIFYGQNDNFFIGDSAHGFIPSRAQGAAQAIEDAYILFNLINDNKISLNKFNQIRKKRIKKIINKSENNIFIFHQFFFIFRWIRNFYIKLICSSRLLTKLTNNYIFNYNFKNDL